MSDHIPPDIPRAALVTGGAQRLGFEMVRELAHNGFDVAIPFNTRRAGAEQVRDEVLALGRRAVILQADLALEADTERLLPAAVAALGPIGVLVNNASRFDREDWQDVTRATWDSHIEPNLRAPFVLTQAFAQALPADAQGVVVNLLDQRVWSLTPHFVSYTVSKAALWSLTQTMALALAPRIRVNGIGPGPALPSLRQTDEQFAAQCRAMPLQRGTSPEEIARALIAILTLPGMTGQMIALDGGQHLQYSPPGGVGQVE